MHSVNILNLTLPEIEKVLIGIGQPPYRAKQIYKWIYEKGVESFDEMANLPKPLIRQLNQRYFINTFKDVQVLTSQDKSKKVIFTLMNGKAIESVIIPTRNRSTICISTQIGCRFKCSFCASGMKGFTRNLSPAEMINQITYAKFHLKEELTNYVFMGMGEPLDNYKNLTKTLYIMNSKEALNIGARRITISTSGITPAVKKLKDLKMQINLSLSLHAVNNLLRNKLMPINRKHPLEPLIDAVNEYAEFSGRMVTLEYIVLAGVNNSFKDACELVDIASKLHAKVNLISYSRVKGLNFKEPTESDMQKFLSMLIKRRCNVTVRDSRGKDIDAACGQLAGKNN